jgi:hypothetical protein
MATKNFKSKEAYRKWLAYAKMHESKPSKKPAKVKIAGNAHKVNRKSR